MRASHALTLACASIAAASPLVKKAIVTEIDTEVVVVYVTVDAGIIATALPTQVLATTTTTPVVVPTVTAATATAAATSGTSGGSGSNGCDLVTPTDYASNAVYWHNVHRCNNSAPALTWDSTLAGYAATLAATCNFHHDVTIGGGGYGQNIASYGTSESPSSIDPSTQVASAASEMWYNGEIGLFDFDWYGLASPDMSNFEGWGHYTQVVWAATTKVGCASQYCPAGGLFSTMGGWFTVCNYDPAGNMGGAYGDNVLKPLGHASVHYTS